LVRTKPYLLILNKNNAPHECGNPKCKVIALGLLSDERFPRDHRHQPAASLANRIAGARKQRASAANAELHQLACVVPGDGVSKANLYTNWLAPGFIIDSRERKHSSIKVQTAKSQTFEPRLSKVTDH
jgi:sarcosine oxidase gamma subunit